MFRSHFSRRARSLSESAGFDGIEPLEQRLAMSTMHWSGAGDGVTINDKRNWVGEHAPHHNDTAIIDITGSPELVLSKGLFMVKELVLNESLTITGGRFHIGENGAAVGGSLHMAGGRITGEGDLNTTGQLTWTGGNMYGSGKINVAPTGRFTIAGEGDLDLRRDVVNHGRIEWTGGNIEGTEREGITITNEADGILKATGQGSFRSLRGPGLIDNRGLLVRDTAGETLVLAEVRSSGIINVAGGTLQLWGGGANSGQRNVAQGAILHYYGDFTHTAGSTLAGGGSTIWQGGVHTIASGHSMDSYLYLSNATVSGPGTWHVDGVLAWSHGRMEGTGGTVIGPTGKIEIRTFGQHTLARNIDNHGTMIWARGELTLEGATITNHSGRMLFLYADSTATAAAGQNLIVNQGEVRKIGFSTLGLGGIVLDNQGEVFVRNGTLNLGQAQQFTDSTLTGGAWKAFGIGRLNFAGGPIKAIGGQASVTRIGASAEMGLGSLERNDGVLDVVGGTLSLIPATGGFINAGELTLRRSTTLSIQGDFVQEASGRLNIGIASIYMQSAGSTSSLIVARSASLAGTLYVVPLGFVPLAGEQYGFFSIQSNLGQFGTVQFEFGPSALVQYLSQSVALVY